MQIISSTTLIYCTELANSMHLLSADILIKWRNQTQFITSSNKTLRK